MIGTAIEVLRSLEVWAVPECASSTVFNTD
jgi:hypothetical protein